MSEYSEWYAANKERLQEKRRKRYKEDPDYKDRVGKYSKTLRKRKQVEHQNERLAAGKLVPTVNTWRRLVKAVDGQELELFTIGAVVTATGRTAATLRHWERRGLISGPSFKEGAYRLYSQEEIDKIVSYSTLVGAQNAEKH